MFKTACPACGAEVQFRSAASVMAVCGYCRSTLLRDAETVANVGRIAEAFEDYSPIQIGTCGQYGGKNFTVIGRIQMRYADGFWNEWYALFDDGTAGWLADGSGQFVFTVAAGSPNRAPAFRAPAFAQIRPGLEIPFEGQRFTATDVRTAQCVAGEGELPFQVGEGWQARVADFRVDDRFLTLDYGEGEVPKVYLGHAVTLEAMNCQLLRDPDRIEGSAGKLKGKAVTLECPACGNAISYRDGMAMHVVCAYCHAEVAIDDNKASVLQTHERLSRITTTLRLGDVATIDKKKWVLIGLMRLEEGGTGGSSTWTEYLLFNARQGFRWLVESEQGWTITVVMNALPRAVGGTQVRWDNRVYTKRWEYSALVVYAAGAFNWRVKIGDLHQVCDYYAGNLILSREQCVEEVTWSASRPVGEALLAGWFGRTTTNRQQALQQQAEPLSGPLRGYAQFASFMLCVINGWNMISSGFAAVVLTAFAMLLLWLPVWAAGEDGEA